MPSGDEYHVIMAILLLLHEAPENEPAQQHDVANGFSSRSDGRPVSGVQPNSFRRRCRAAEKVSILSGRTCSLPKKICHNGVYATHERASPEAATSRYRKHIRRSIPTGLWSRLGMVSPDCCGTQPGADACLNNSLCKSLHIVRLQDRRFHEPPEFFKFPAGKGGRR